MKIIGQILDRLDGCVLVSGADLDPRNDGFMLHASVKTMKHVANVSIVDWPTNC